jgi:aspartyl-tRNA(Asn)/glutamyl-tRNA(Gln) amidotransferase subunit A
MTDLTSLTLAAALEGMEAKAFTSAELTDAFLAAIEEANPHLNAFVVVTADKAKAAAKASDAKRAAGKAGPLEGAPLGIKDLFCTEGVRTTACSGILGEFTPTYESTVSGKLFKDGALMLGKLNMDEFAMGSSNETSRFGPVVSPWRRGNDDAALTPGDRQAARRRR